MKLKPSEIKLNPDNPRLIKDERFTKLVTSLKEFPEMANVREVIINMDNVILGGNMRFKAMVEAGWDEIPVKQVDWSEDKQKEFIIKDNASFGEWDWDIVANIYELEDLEAWGVDLPVQLQNQEVEEDEAPPVSTEPAVSKLGEIYQLGRHRLMCGDSTKDIDDLINHTELNLLLTDPPYNLGFDYNTYDDNKTKDEYVDLLQASIITVDCNKKIITTGKQNLQLWYDHSEVTDIAIWYSTNKMSGGKISNLSLWEPIVFIGKFDRNSRPTDVFEYTNENQKDIGNHSCPKTVKFFGDIINSYSSKNDIVLDTFGGSGTTLIACEQLDRTCYMMELDPKYCDVIRKRYWKFVNEGSDEGWESNTPIINSVVKA